MRYSPAAVGAAPGRAMPLGGFPGRLPRPPDQVLCAPVAGPLPGDPGRLVRAVRDDPISERRWSPSDVELDRLVMRIRAARATAQQHEERARRLTEQVLQLPSGGTVRDLALLLGLSHQRIHQMMQRHIAGLSTVEDEPA